MPNHRAHVIALEEAVADGMLTKDDVDSKIAPHVNRFGDGDYWADLAALSTPPSHSDDTTNPGRKLPSGPVVRATPEAREALHALLMSHPGDD
jgi:hypothetical protein